MVALYPVYWHTSDMEAITPELCRAARGLLDWTGDDLAREARVALNTVRKIETGKTVPMPNNLSAIQAAFERAGIEFIPENGGGAGVRRRASSK